MPGRCALCLDDRNISGICAECRARLENAAREVARWKKDAEGWKRLYFKAVGERKRLERGRPRKR